MEIRLAQGRDIPGMIALLYQVGEVHHVIRPDIFCSGALKYDEKALEALKHAFPECKFEVYPLSPAFITQGGPSCFAMQVIEE